MIRRTDADTPTEPPSSARFEAPDFARPLDAAAWIEGIPDDVTAFARGLFAIARTIGDEAEAIVKKHGLEPTRRALLREVVAAYLEVASTCLPALPVREALRRMCWQIYPTFRTSSFGRSVLAPREYDPLVLIARVAEILDEFMEARFRVIARDAVSVTLFFEHLYALRAMDVGIFEGALQAIGAEGRVLVSEGDERRGFIKVVVDRGAQQLP